MIDLREGILCEFAERAAWYTGRTEWATFSHLWATHNATANQARCPAKHREDMRQRRSDPGYRERERKAQAKRRAAKKRADRLRFLRNQREAAKAARAKRLHSP